MIYGVEKTGISLLSALVSDSATKNCVIPLFEKLQQKSEKASSETNC